MNRLIQTRNARNLLLTCTRAVVIAATCGVPVWAQVEPVPKSISPLPEARFFDTRPTVGAPLAPQYRNRQPAEADAARPDIPSPAAKGEASQAAPAVNGTTKAPRTDECVNSTSESASKCVELIAK
jgi:hypothetical protein